MNLTDKIILDMHPDETDLTLDIADYEFFNEYEFVMKLIDLSFEGYTKNQIVKFAKDYFDNRIKNNLKKPPHRRKSK